MIINNPINVALVGCGRISNNHIKAIYSLGSKANLSAICDLRDSRLNNAMNECRRLSTDSILPSIYSDYSILLESFARGELAIDLVVLATPSGLHAMQTIEAARHGLNVCTEKPMATSWIDGLEMVRACDAAGVRLFVVKQNRFNETLKLVKEKIDSGRFGKIYLVTVNVFWQRPQEYYNSEEWRGTWKFDGGALMNQASHYVDLLEWLIGPVNCVNAFTSTLGRDIEVEDTAVMNLRWKSGTLGAMSVTMLTYPENMEGSITILGEKGTVRIGGTAVNKVETFVFEGDDLDSAYDASNASYNIDSIYGYGHLQYYENMIKNLQGIDVPICDGREGLQSLQLIVASYLSAKEQRPVYLPLEI